MMSHDAEEWLTSFAVMTLILHWYFQICAAVRLCKSKPHSNNHAVQMGPNHDFLKSVTRLRVALQGIFFSQAESCCSPSCSEETTTKIWWTLHLERNLCRSDLARWQMSVLRTNILKFSVKHQRLISSRFLMSGFVARSVAHVCERHGPQRKSNFDDWFALCLVEGFILTELWLNIALFLYFLILLYL